MFRKRQMEDSSDDEDQQINKNAAKIARRSKKKRMFNDSNIAFQTDDSDDSTVCLSYSSI